MKDLKNELVISEVKKDFVVVNFGSRWSLDVYERFMSEVDILDLYNDWCKECRKDDLEYLIEEFGICNRFVDGMWSICMSDDSSYLYIEKDKFEDICNELEDCEDKRVYEIVGEIEEKYDLFV